MKPSEFGPTIEPKPATPTVLSYSTYNLIGSPARRYAPGSFVVEARRSSDRVADTYVTNYRVAERLLKEVAGIEPAQGSS
jgi:hypothetical protein